MLPGAEAERATRYRSKDARAEFVTGAFLVRAICATITGTAFADAEVLRPCRGCDENHGPPKMVAAPSWSLSVTHSHGRVGVAVARHAQVGLDLERIAGDVDAALERAVSSQSEFELLRSASGFVRHALFVRAWCRKEALVKAYGVGLGVPLSAVDVSGESPAIDSQRAVGLDVAPGACWLPLGCPWEGFASALFSDVAAVLVDEVCLADMAALADQPDRLAQLIPLLPWTQSLPAQANRAPRPG
ncbi:4'-phosphopantetheinyl transferase family protein [Paenarthrobacter sp. NPDC089675]|uniref:4'-phosphopantetheinyl transferase family protein n=1 Tax=Paenarthrobacter sp. NPDC089675 TaxID=3364376 RepID=UPI003825C985